MNKNMQVMPEMQHNVATMAFIIHKMQYDTSLMRHSVYGMEQNTHSMMFPMRMMNGFLP
jgi:hypothetical protein